MDEPETVKRMKSYKVKPKMTGPDRRPVSTKRTPSASQDSNRVTFKA